VECKLRSVNFRRVSDPRRVFRLAFRVTGISDNRYRSNWNLWWLIQEYDVSDCDKFGSTLERRRELLVHLGVSPNQRGNHKQTLRDAWVLMDIHSEDCRRYLRLFGCTWTIDFPQQRMWCMDYCSLSLLNHTSRHLLQHCILCLATSGKRRKKVRFKHKCRDTETIPQLSDWKISIKHGVNVIHSISHLIRANESRNTQFINSTKKLEALLVFADY